MELVEEFEKEYCREEEEEVRCQEAEEDRKVFSRELPGRYTAKLLYDGATRNTIENIGSIWRKIGDGGRKIHSLDIVEICS